MFKTGELSIKFAKADPKRFSVPFINKVRHFPVALGLLTPKAFPISNKRKLSNPINGLFEPILSAYFCTTTADNFVFFWQNTRENRRCFSIRKCVTPASRCSRLKGVSWEMHCQVNSPLWLILSLKNVAPWSYVLFFICQLYGWRACMSSHLGDEKE